MELRTFTERNPAFGCSGRSCSRRVLVIHRFGLGTAGNTNTKYEKGDAALEAIWTAYYLDLRMENPETRPSRRKYMTESKLSLTVWPHGGRGASYSSVSCQDSPEMQQTAGWGPWEGRIGLPGRRSERLDGALSLGAASCTQQPLHQICTAAVT